MHHNEKQLCFNSFKNYAFPNGRCPVKIIILPQNMWYASYKNLKRCSKKDLYKSNKTMQDI